MSSERMAGEGKPEKRRMEPEPVAQGEESLETRKKKVKTELEKLDFANAGSK